MRSALFVCRLQLKGREQSVCDQIRAHARSIENYRTRHSAWSPLTSSFTPRIGKSKASGVWKVRIENEMCRFNGRHSVFRMNKKQMLITCNADCGTYTNVSLCWQLSFLISISIWENYLLFAVRPWIHEWNHRFLLSDDGVMVFRTTIDDGTVRVIVLHFHLLKFRCHTYGRKWFPSDECIAPKDAHAHDLMQCVRLISTHSSHHAAARSLPFPISRAFGGNEPTEFSHICLTC